MRTRNQFLLLVPAVIPANKDARRPSSPFQMALSLSLHIWRPLLFPLSSSEESASSSLFSHPKQAYQSLKNTPTPIPSRRLAPPSLLPLTTLIIIVLLIVRNGSLHERDGIGDTVPAIFLSPSTTRRRARRDRGGGWCGCQATSRAAWGCRGPCRSPQVPLSSLTPAPPSPPPPALSHQRMAISASASPPAATDATTASPISASPPTRSSASPSSSWTAPPSVAIPYS